jgi:hypothetical protein
MATEMIGRPGDIRSAMGQGGWLDAQSLMGYTRDISEGDGGL